MVMFSLAAGAQTKFETRVQSKTVGKGDPFRVEYVIQNAEKINSFQEPQFSAFVVVQGPSQGSTTSIVNGNVSQYVYVSYVLQAKKPGQFTIPGATAVIDGEKLRSNSIKIEVVAGSTGRPPVTAIVPNAPRPRRISSSNKELYLKPGDNPLDKIRDNLFVKATADRTQCYVGEPVVSTYKLYTRLQSESRVSKRPTLNGFSVYDMINPEQPHSTTESINGKEYNVYYIRKTQLYPLQPGKVTLEPVEVDNKVLFYKSPEEQRPGTTMDDLVREFFNDVPMGEPEEHTLTLSSKPIEITVLPLPEENKPENFSGAVGDFKISTRLEADGIATGKAGKLKVVVSGAGNLPMITAPAIDWPASFDGFTPEVKEELDKSTAPINGTKTFEYVFTPSDTGVFTIPALEFSFFNPRSKNYETIRSSPIVVDVAMGVDYKAKPDLAENTPAEGMEESTMVMKMLIGGTLLLLAIAGIIAYVARRKSRTRYKTKPVATPKPYFVPETPVEPVAKEHVPVPEQTHEVNWKELDGLIYCADSKPFFQNLGNQLWNFFAGELQLSGSERNKKALVQKMTAAGMRDEDIVSATRILEACELALYTPGHSRSDMQVLFNDAQLLVKNTGRNRGV